MANFSFWLRWLLVVSSVITVFGALMALSSGTPPFDLFNHQIDPAFWGANTAGEGAKLFQQWVYGIWGATIAGWGVFMIFIVSHAFRQREKWAWGCLAAGTLVWFVLDTTLSLNYRVYFNAAFNAAVLILVALPLLFTWKHFSP